MPQATAATNCGWPQAYRAGVAAASDGAGLGNPGPSASPGTATVLREAAHDHQ